MRKIYLILVVLFAIINVNAQELVVVHKMRAKKIAVDNEKNIIVYGTFMGDFDFDFSIFRNIANLKLKYDFVISKEFCLIQNQFSFWSESAA